MPQASGATEMVHGGAAVTSEVCWLVGDAGLVLVTTDGESWHRLPPPTTAALVSVTATGAGAASVTTREGRTFTTTDGGLTWVLK